MASSEEEPTGFGDSDDGPAATSKDKRKSKIFGTLKRIKGPKADGFRTKRKVYRENQKNLTPLEDAGSPESSWGTWHTLRSTRTKKYTGNAWYKVPIFNFFYGFYDIENDPPEWSQMTSLLTVLAIVNALLLGLVCTFYSTIDFEEMYSAELRFNWGTDHRDHPAFRAPDATTRYNARYFQFNSPECFGYDNSRACIDEWRDAGNNVAGWVGATNGTSATTEGSPYYPWCAYPCLADRPYQGDDMSDSFTTGNYAQYWLTRRVLKVNGDAAVAALKAEEHLVGNRDKICAEDETEGGYMCKHTQSPTEEFANFSTLSAAFLSTSLLLSILVLAAGSSNTFAKEQETGGMAYQYRSVARAYLYWVRFVNLGTIFFTIFGTIFFVQSLKAMVYVKYTDSLVEVDGYSQAFGFYFKADSPYTFVNSATIWLCYVPITFSAIVLSVSTAMLNSFPAHSETDLNNVTKVTLAARRKAHADDLADFLQHIGTLPRFHAAVTTGDNVSPEEEMAALSGFNSEGPRLGCYGKHKAFRTDMGVTLKGAGGDGSYEAESVADALVDAGICDVRSLCRLVLHDELGGLGEMPPLYQMARLTPGAVLTVMLGIRKFAAINATDNASAAEDESAKVAAVRIPSSHFKYLMESFKTDNKPVLDNVPTISGMTEGASDGAPEMVEFSKMLQGRGPTTKRQAKGWKALAGDGYSSYQKMVVHSDAELEKLFTPDADDKSKNKQLQANERAKLAKLNKMRESAKLKIDAVILWWMEKLRTDYMFVSDEKKSVRVRCKPRIPDAELFPREHKFVINWLLHDENATKDARLAFVELKEEYKDPNPPGKEGWHPTKSFKIEMKDPVQQKIYDRRSAAAEKLAKELAIRNKKTHTIDDRKLLKNSRFLKEIVGPKALQAVVKRGKPEAKQMGQMGLQQSRLQSDEPTADQPTAASPSPSLIATL